MNNKKPYLISAGLIILVLLVDQVSKFLVKTSMYLGEEFSVFGNWFYIHFTENPGMAFGMEFAGEYGKLFLSLFRVVAVILIGIYIHKTIKKGAAFGFVVSMSLIMAGAIGNIIDSAFYGLVFNDSMFQIASFMPEGGGYASFMHGKVVDMLYFPLIEGHYPSWVPYLGSKHFLFFRPVFNIADSSITIGVLMILLFQKRFFPKD